MIGRLYPIIMIDINHLNVVLLTFPTKNVMMAAIK